MKPQPTFEPSPAITPFIPPIFRLIEQGASPDLISQQMYSDYFSTRDNERVYLGIRALQSKGPEGLAQIRMMSHGTDELSQLLKKIQDEQLSGIEIEGILGISRLKHLIKPKTNSDEELKLIYEKAVKLGFVGSIEDLSRHMGEESNAFTVDKTPVHLSGKIEDFMFNFPAVFGVEEPKYLELLGPEEILRLRMMKRPRMLLLGSLGIYSARDFSKYGKKINKNTESMVLEINTQCVNLIREDKENDILVIKGDAKDMPIEKDSVDHIYTNHLFHFILSPSKAQTKEQEGIEEVMRESARVLKKGGSLIISEQEFGEYQNKANYEKMLYEVRLLAQQSGFSKTIIITDGVGYVFRVDNMSAVIDENGFPHYNEALLTSTGKNSISCRFIK